MIDGMQEVERVTITLPAEIVEQVREAVADGRAGSVSAYIREAVEDRAGRADSDRAWAEHFERSGTPSRAHYLFALRQVLNADPPAELVEEMIRRDAELVAGHRRLPR